MTFGHLVAHMIDSNYYLCAKASDVAQPKVDAPKETDKTALVGALKASFDFCSTSLAKVDDTKVGDTIDAYGGREVPRAWALIALTNDWADHYSASATYLRLNGLLPPTAQPKKQRFSRQYEGKQHAIRVSVAGAFLRPEQEKGFATRRYSICTRPPPEVPGTVTPAAPARNQKSTPGVRMTPCNAERRIFR